MKTFTQIYCEAHDQAVQENIRLIEKSVSNTGRYFLNISYRALEKPIEIIQIDELNPVQVDIAIDALRNYSMQLYLEKEPSTKLVHVSHDKITKQIIIQIQ